MKKTFGLLIAAAAIFITVGLSTSVQAADKTEVKIATGAYPKPYAYEENGKLKGFDIDLARAVFKKLPKYDVSFEKTEFPSILSGIDSGRYQMGANSFAKDKERSKKYLFSTPLYRNPMGLMVPENSKIKKFSDIAGKSTSGEPAVSYSVLLEDYNKTHKQNPVKITYTEEDMVKQLRNVEGGKYDFKLESAIIGRQVIKDNGLKLKTIEVPKDAVKSRAAYSYFIFGKDEQGRKLQKQVDKVLSELQKDGTITKLSKQYFGADYTVK